MINKIDVKKIIIKIFDYIEQGEEITEYETFKGHPGLYFFHSKDEFNNILDLSLTKEEYDRYDIYYIVQKMIKFLLNKYDTQPFVPKFPPDLSKTCLRSAAVLFLLSVEAFTITATPFGPYPSYVISS